jgi:hypothetical protein
MVQLILISAAFFLVIGLIVFMMMRGKGKSIPGTETTTAPTGNLRRTVRSSGPED